MKYDSFLYRVIRILWWEICRLFPINKRKIFFSSYYGNGYSDNLKYIANELLNDTSIIMIWSCKGEKEASSLPEGIRASYCGSLRWVYHLTTSAIWIDNCRKAFRYKKPKQFYIQTYHGTGAGKKCERDVENNLSKNYVKMAIKDASNTDLMISPDSNMTRLYHTVFWYSGPVYQIGFPRMDILFKGNTGKIKEKVACFFNKPFDINFVLYAPTFRSDSSFDAYSLDYERVLQTCKERFNHEYIMLVHLHPNVADRFSEIIYDSNVLNATSYPDMQELMVASDILIGDYSSVNHEYSVMKKPVFLYASDINEYRKDRDFYLPIEDYPFPVATNNDELVSNIIKFDDKKYIEELDAYHKRIGVEFNKNASFDCSNMIKSYLELGCDKSKFFEKYRAFFV